MLSSIESVVPWSGDASECSSSSDTDDSSVSLSGGHSSCIFDKASVGTPPCIHCCICLSLMQCERSMCHYSVGIYAHFLCLSLLPETNDMKIWPGLRYGEGPSATAGIDLDRFKF